MCPLPARDLLFYLMSLTEGTFYGCALSKPPNDIRPTFQTTGRKCYVESQQSFAFSSTNRSNPDLICGEDLQTPVREVLDLNFKHPLAGDIFRKEGLFPLGPTQSGTIVRLLLAPPCTLRRVRLGGEMKVKDWTALTCEELVWAKFRSAEGPEVLGRCLTRASI